jgi:DNA-binding CsgD family transcriptional regulator/PAS domain-containing protein
VSTTEIGLSVRHEQVLRVLQDIAALVRDVVDPRELGSKMAAQARQLLGADAASIYLWKEASGFLESAFGNDPPLRPGESVIGDAFAQQRPVLLPTAATDAYSLAAIPLTVGKRTLGVLALRNDRPRPYSPEDLIVLMLLAAFVAPALDRAHWQAESERQRRAMARESERLSNLLEQLPSGVIVLEEHGLVALSNPAARRMLNVAIEPDKAWVDQVSGFVPFDPGERRLLRKRETPAVRVLAGEQVHGAEVRVQEAERNLDIWLRIDGVPLRESSGRVSGAVLVYTDVTRERTLARDLAATALEHARLLGKLAERKERLEELADRVGGAPWLQQRAERAARLDALTSRERDVLRLLARGLTNREIGAALHLSTGTVRNCVGRLLSKLGTTDRTQAAVMAVTLGALDGE